MALLAQMNSIYSGKLHGKTVSKKRNFSPRKDRRCNLEMFTVRQLMFSLLPKISWICVWRLWLTLWSKVRILQIWIRPYPSSQCIPNLLQQIPQKWKVKVSETRTVEQHDTSNSSNENHALLRSCTSFEQVQYTYTNSLVSTPFTIYNLAALCLACVLTLRENSIQVTYYTLTKCL